MTSARLVVSDLQVRVSDSGGKPVRPVDGVSFAIEAGERVGLVGESGAGKSLTTLALPGLLPAGLSIEHGSSIRLNDRELVGLSNRRLREVRGRRIGMVFQNPSAALNPALAVGRQIEEVVRAHRDLRRRAAREEAVRLLDEVGILEPERTVDDPPHRLSGGMCQRVCIALALAGEPELLVADEPTTALDVTVQARILDLLVRLSETRGLSLLLVSHDLAVVAATCHRVLVMYAGRVVEEGGVFDVLRDPLHPYTRALLAARPRLSGPRVLPEPIPGTVPTAADWPTGCRFHPRCSRVMDRCPRDEPPSVREGARRVRCWLHGPDRKAGP